MGIGGTGMGTKWGQGTGAGVPLGNESPTPVPNIVPGVMKFGGALGMTCGRGLDALFPFPFAPGFQFGARFGVDAMPRDTRRYANTVR